MALTTYVELQAAIASWLARDDLTSNIPDFITLFEAAAARRLRVRPTETSTTLTPSSGSVALPSGYLGYKRVTWSGSPVINLEFLHPALLQSYYPDSAEGTPAHFTIEGSTLKVRPVSNTALDFLYFAKNTAVSSSLNWLFTAYPDVYLFGALCEAEGFMKDDNRLVLWKARRDEVFSEIHSVNFREGQALAMRPTGPVI
jgi:hypothetical protein